MKVKKSSRACRMDKKILRARVKRAAINLAPSAAILAVIALGSALRLPWFELSWQNDVLFVLLAIAVLLPLTKLPLLFLNGEDSLFSQIDTWGGVSAQERDAQIELLQQRLQDASLQVRESTQ